MRCKREGVRQVRKNGFGDEVEGYEYDISVKPVVFNPKAWHGTCAWKGDRWVLTTFVSRGLENVELQDKDFLKECGFPVPEGCEHEAYTLLNRLNPLGPRSKPKNASTNSCISCIVPPATAIHDT